MAEKTPDRLALEARAEALQLKYPANIGDDKLTRRVEGAEAKAAQDAAGKGDKTTPSTTPSTPPAKAMVVVVTGPKKGRWRAGRFFTSEPVSIPLADLSEDDQAALLGDPCLTVETREAD